MRVSVLPLLTLLLLLVCGTVDARWGTGGKKAIDEKKKAAAAELQRQQEEQEQAEQAAAERAAASGRTQVNVYGDPVELRPHISPRTKRLSRQHLKGEDFAGNYGQRLYQYGVTDFQKVSQTPWPVARSCGDCVSSGDARL